MANDPGADISMTEFLDSLERGKRTYECFKHAIAIGQRLANYEQVERELLARVDVAKAAAAKAEADSRELVAACERESTEARGRSARAIETIKKDESAKIEALHQQTLVKSNEMKAELASLTERVEQKARELNDLTARSIANSNEIRRIEKQLENVREAKRALLEA